MKPVLNFPLLRNLAALGVAAAASFTLLAPHTSAAPAPAVTAQVQKARPDYGKIPLSFEANGGQTDASVNFFSRGPGYALFLTDDEAVIRLASKADAVQAATAQTPQESVLRMKLLGADKPQQVAGTERQAGSANYFIGNDPKQWHTGVKTYGRVNYSGVYPGVDLVYYGNQRELEYDLVVAPGADASQIALAFDGAAPSINAQGDLVLPVAGNEVRFHKPVVYQQVGEVRKTIEARYLVAGNEARFQLDDYDHGQPLVIDPVLSYMTYLGGSNSEYIGSFTGEGGFGAVASNGIAVDSQGSVYVTGSTYSTDFPVKNASQAAGKQLASYQTGFVAKLNTAGTALVYSTFLGGSAYDYSQAIVVDAAGSAYVTGSTYSQDFPTTASAFQKLCAPIPSVDANGNFVTVPSCGNGRSNAFVTKLSPDGTSLAYSTYLGGADPIGGDAGYAIAVDASGQAHVTGASGDACHPGDVAGSFGNGVYLYHQPYECFPTTANAFVQGTENDTGSSNAPYDGGTRSIQPEHEQGNGFLSVFSANGSSLVYSTLLSHSTLTSPGVSQRGLNGKGIAIDPSGKVYIAGATNIATLSVTPGAFQTTTGPVFDTSTQAIPLRAFIEKFAAVGAGGSGQPVYVSYLGGSTTRNDNYPTGIAVDADGNAYVYGHSQDPGYPTTAGAYQTTCGRFVGDTLCSSGVLTKMKPDGSAPVWSTFIGDLISGSGSGSVPYTTGIAIDAARNVYIAGTSDNSFPQVNPIQTNNGGSAQAFIAELNASGSSLLFATNVGSGGAVGSQGSNGLALDAQGNIYLAGTTNTANSLPVTPGALQGAFAGGQTDSFIAKIIRFAASTTNLTISPASVVAGSSATLTATVSPPSGGSTPTGTVTFKMGTTTTGTATLNPTGIASTTVTLPAGSYSFTAIYGGDNSYSASTSSVQTLTVTAPAAAPTVTIAVSPTSVVLGSSATLTWSSTNATACTASGAWSGTETSSGTKSVTPTAAGSSTYTLSCTGAGGSTSNAAVLTVTAPPPVPTLTIAVSPTSITLGASATLTWSSTNATACTATGAWTGTEATSGSLSVTPTATGTSTYTLACTGTGGSKTGSAALTVTAAGTTPPPKKGGGSFGLWSLLPMLLAGAIRRRRKGK